MGVEDTLSPEPPLVFVYLGREIPKYTHASLRFAAEGHAGKTLLLTNSSHQLAGDSAYEVEDFQSWYDPSHFQLFRENTTLDPHFRGGFWLHVVERFFVLRQYMERQKLDGLFHAELDVMVFDLFGVAEACNAHGSGVFAVMDDPSRALASLFYVNSSEKFDHFLSFALSQPHMRNEMEMIGSYLQEFPDSGHSLPSDRFFDRGAHPLSPSAVDDRLGLFDASAFGQWLFGLDPKNIKLTVTNHFWNPMAQFPIDRLQFRLPLFGRRLTAKMPGGEKRQVRALHVHSKILPRLAFRPTLIFYLWVNNLPIRWVVLRKRGWWQTHLLAGFLRGRGFSFVRAVHSAAPRLVVSWLLRLTSDSAVPLSSRQRELVVGLLPEVEKLRGPQVPLAERLLNATRQELQTKTASTRALTSTSTLVCLPEGKGLAKDEADADLEALIVQILQTESESVLVCTSDESACVQLNLNESGPVPLVVTAEKLDSEWTLVASRWGERLFSPLSFSPLALIVRPSWVREMFPGGSDDVKSWLSSSEAFTWLMFVQAYGAWVRTHHPRSVILVRDIEERQ